MKLLDYILIALFFGVGTALSIRRLKNDPELRAILRRALTDQGYDVDDMIKRVREAGGL